MPFWTVAQTESQREHVAAKFLEQATFEIYLPKVLIRNGARDRVAPLFPGYVFVAIIDQWWPVRWTTGVLKLLMVNDRPAEVSEVLMRDIRKREGKDGLVRLPKPRPRGLLPGDPVKVTRGSFADRFGVYQGQSGAQRSKILLNWLGREVRVEIATADVARAGRMDTCAAG